MVGINVNKIWLIRESKGSDIYYLTGDPDFVKFFKEHRRHWGNLVWVRGLQEDKKYSYWAHLWLLKTYLVILNEVGSGHWYLLMPWPYSIGDRLKSDLGDGFYQISPEHIFKDTYRFDFGSNQYSGSVIKSFRDRLRTIEREVWNHRNLLGECSLDWSNIQFLIEPKYRLPRVPEGPYDRWRIPETPTKEHKTQTSWISRILKKIRAA